MHMLFVTYRWQFQILLYLIYFSCADFTAAHRLLYCDVQALQHMGSVAEHMLSCGVWDLSSQPETEPGLLALGVQSLNHWTAREVPGIHFYLLLGMKAECPAQKEQQRQETPDFQEREGHQGQRDVAPRPRGSALLKTQENSTHCIHLYLHFRQFQFWPHQSHQPWEDNIQALRWTRPKTSLRIASAIKLSCSDWNTMEKGLAEGKKNK